MSAVLLIYKRQNSFIRMSAVLLVGMYLINLLSLQIRLKKEINIYYWVL